MDDATPLVRKLRHTLTQDIYFMRFGPASTRFVRDNEPDASVFTHHGRPRQVSRPYPLGAPTPPSADPTHWDPDPLRPDWAYSQRRHFTEDVKDVSHTA